MAIQMTWNDKNARKYDRKKRVKFVASLLSMVYEMLQVVYDLLINKELVYILYIKQL